MKLFKLCFAYIFDNKILMIIFSILQLVLTVKIFYLSSIYISEINLNISTSDFVETDYVNTIVIPYILFISYVLSILIPLFIKTSYIIDVNYDKLLSLRLFNLLNVNILLLLVFIISYLNLFIISKLINGSIYPLNAFLLSLIYVSYLYYLISKTIQLYISNRYLFFVLSVLFNIVFINYFYKNYFLGLINGYISYHCLVSIFILIIFYHALKIVEFKFKRMSN